MAGIPENTLFMGFIWVTVKRRLCAGKRAVVPACLLQNTLEQSHFLELNEREVLVEVWPQRDLNTVVFLSWLGRL